MKIQGGSGGPGEVTRRDRGDLLEGQRSPGVLENLYRPGKIVGPLGRAQLQSRGGGQGRGQGEAEEDHAGNAASPLGKHLALPSGWQRARS